MNATRVTTRQHQQIQLIYISHREGGYIYYPTWCMLLQGELCVHENNLC